MEQLSVQKLHMRKQFKEIRNNIETLHAQQWSEEACAYAISLAQQRGWREVMVYIPFRSELQLWPFIEWCWQHQITIIVPKCLVETHTMQLYPLYNKDQLRLGAYQILEPNSDQLTPINTVPDAVIVPGLVYTKDGARLGYGGGYYDRFYELMGQQEKQITWIGIGYETQITDHIPMDEYDIKLNILITNKGITTCS
ncbi:MAG: 5-formyltetrahydrofolate cyclo-ligase [Candidatus Pristimantibacillus lignocellulolyticus]|uniref:5-formyltetrahydrofolate cyclo-ligase n=1 Tax=Candidatus Pristimantibacillus lignocellulolyticus TaxID=2994561 RepID=A0A9J6ZLU0_9BACL|nr:MAG: 5-formyltetrahydrofolate cyclo-ligase [Candidatus Pristimantibacillus lignocellulolyticus]